VSIDEQKQNFMTLLWKQGGHVGPKILPPKKGLPHPLLTHMHKSFPETQKHNLSFALSNSRKIDGYLFKRLGKEVPKEPFLFFQVFFIWKFLVR
jgi:hypothetical protein